MCTHSIEICFVFKQHSIDLSCPYEYMRHVFLSHRIEHTNFNFILTFAEKNPREFSLPNKIVKQYSVS